MKPSFATRYNLELIDEQYDRWIKSPETVDPVWSAFFEGFELGSAVPQKAGTAAAGSSGSAVESSLQTRVDGLVYAYRTLGHTIAKLDPLEEQPPDQPLLSLSELGFREADLDLPVSSKFYRGGKQVKLRELMQSLKETYSSTCGFEFMHIQNPKVRNWVRERIEARATASRPGVEVYRRILKSLIAAEEFEHFLHTKYVGQKRFSLEGGESLMVILDSFFQALPSRGVQEIVMGMAHRGRLTVLANFLGKSVKQLFTEFSENYIPDAVGGDGDVKYHLGYVATRQTDSGEYVSIRLAANPSHLEAVDPVVEGMTRARQRILGDSGLRKKVIPLLIHGDAAFAGQGLVAELLNISQLPGYRTGGTVHVVINNQIGFTTLPADARSTEYATDVAKMIEAPIFHVNGDDPIACHFVTELALDFRQTFARDVVIDMICFRRHGHNEADEPVFTQPDLYKQIHLHPSVLTQFRKKLSEEGIVPAEEIDRMEKEFQQGLENALAEVRQAEQRKADGIKTPNAPVRVPQPAFSFTPVNTNITPETLDHIVRKITEIPENFKVLPKVKRILVDRRLQLYKQGGPYDWAFAETLAFGSLLIEGTPVRLSGQDSRRGTFSQRHSVLYDYESRARHIPLLNLTPTQARFCVYNSSLSEAAILGFDYGYSLDFPEMLCMWEAQFGDFANGAQVIIDQFIASAESKWQRFSGIVMLLPHGYEGQGPEHSSGKMERFLQLCAEENMQVANVTTPAQYFHLLRRQIKRPFRKPLIIMTPKSLLRSEQCVSYSKDFTDSGFYEILDGPLLETSDHVKRIIFCSGKVYYDLLSYRDANERADVALIRLEQLYPLHAELLKRLTSAYRNVETWIWCQEESQNMGAWTFVQPLISETLGCKLLYAGRNASSSPAVGSLAIHKKEQKQLVEDAFNF